MTSVNTVFDQRPPQDRVIEDVVIGSLLFDRATMVEFIQHLKPEMFYFSDNQIMLEVIQTLHKRNVDVDLLTVIDQLRKIDKLEEVGGASTVSKYTDHVMQTIHMRSHIEILKEQYMRREMFALSMDMARMSVDEVSSPKDTIVTIESRIAAITGNMTVRKPKRLSDLISGTMGVIRKIASGEMTIPGIPTGYRGMDKVMRGLNKGDLIIIAARPSQGKSALMVSMAMRMAAMDLKIAIFSLEMTSDQLSIRILSQATSLSYWLLQSEHVKDRMVQIEEKSIDVSKLPIIIDDTPALTLYDLRNKVLSMTPLPEVIFVDYLQLMDGDNTRGANRENEISKISRGLKSFAKELNVPIVALSQLSRKLEDRSNKRPVLSDLRESGAIEQDADKVMFIFRPHLYGISTINNNMVAESDAYILLSKNRNGKIGDILMRWVAETMSFDDYDKDVELTKEKEDEIPF